MQSFLWIQVIIPWLVVSVNGQNFIGLLQNLVNLDLSETRNISADCANRIIQIRNGLRDREVWALKVLDASSYLSSDFVWGNNIAPGAPRSCNLVNSPVRTYVGPNFVPRSITNLTQISSPFAVNYRVLHARHHSRMQFDIQSFEKNVLDFGFCMPVSCNHVDSEKLFRSLLSSDEFLNRTLLERQPEFLQTKLLEISDEFYQSPFVQGFLIILSVIVILIILDIVHRTCQKIFFNKSSDSVRLKNHKISVCDKILSCFSVKENMEIILFSDRKDSSFPAIDGLRAISMFFFIISHIGLFGTSAITNFQNILVFSEVVAIQPLLAVHLCVDTFYVISATIVSYTFFEYFKTHEAQNKSVLFIKMVIRRYLRLTPSYVVQILMVVTVEKLIKNISPYFLMDDNEPKCEKLWLMNIFYINNFIDANKMCMVWSYFLATDFQLFVISSAILLIIVTWRQLGIALFGVTLISAMGVCGYFGYTLPFTLTLHSNYVTSKYLYTPFWCRLSPYFVGIITGWFLSYKDRTLGLNRKCLIFGWIIAGVLLLSLEFGHIKPDISPVTALFYTALSRFAWAVGYSWIIVACTAGHGGFLGKFLSSKFFLPFSRLTFSAYMVNPSWILLVTMLNDTPLHLDFGMAPVLLLGFILTVYTVALIFSLLFESPFIRLIKLILI